MFSSRSSRFAVIASLVVVALATGCGKNIGDSCSTNVDCSITGDRFCDTAPPGGYCTVEGCDVDTCPDEASCVRFFTPVLSEPCVYDYNSPRGDCTDPTKGCCQADERCVISGTDVSMANCAPEDSERRWCMVRCGSNGDCREGYDCRSTGSLGASPVPTLASPNGDAFKFCVSSGM